ncbi:MAG: FAD-binding protein, partial [Gammaproteobacteria bacterium]
FHASCGGMGLTGVIIEACMQLRSLRGAAIRRQSIPVSNLHESMTVLAENRASPYSVAWLDCLASGADIGRGVVYLGEHMEDEQLEFKSRRGLPVPFSTPSLLLNRFTMKVFNKLIYELNRHGRQTMKVPLERYFFPLDNIRHWNRLYGRRGFLQYQFVLPQESAETGINKVLGKIAAAGKGSFLSVLKQFGPANKNLLSFPMAGYTLALDFKYDRQVLPLLDELDSIVTDHGGRIYLAKDARMSEAVFKRGYPNWEQFREIKLRHDPGSVFASLQSQRLGLTG